MNWVTILENMDEQFRTANEIGAAAPTLLALSRRGYVEKTDTKPATYRITEAGEAYAKIIRYMRSHPTEKEVCVYNDAEPFGSFVIVHIENNDLYDCWGEPYDASFLSGVLEMDEGKVRRVPLV